MLTSFGDQLRVAVVGASGAIGKAFVEQLLQGEQVSMLYALARSEPDLSDPRVQFLPVDFDSEATLQEAAAQISEDGSLDLVIVASGILHEGEGILPEKSLREVSREKLERLFLVNTIGPSLALKELAPLLYRDRKAVFAALSARVGSIGDNQLGGWYAYRASKAALNMMLKCASIELARTHKQAVVLGLHPGTVDSHMSQPFQRNVPKGKLFEPSYSANCLLEVIDAVDSSQTGLTYDWNKQVIPY